MKKPFWRVNIEITNICNLQCSFCPVVIRDKGFMAVDRFAQVLDQVAPFTDVVALHLMGDPLVHPNFEALVDCCEEKGLQIFLVSNGLLLKDSLLPTLLRPVFRQISFSLHSFPDNFGAKDPTAYLQKIFYFTDLAADRRDRLFINYRLWNLADARAQNPEHQQIVQAIEKHFDWKLTDQDTTAQKKYQIAKRVALHMDTEFTWPNPALPFRSEIGTCQGLRSHFGILTDGTVVPCCLDKEGVLALGNLFSTPLKEILSSPLAVSIRDGFKQNRLTQSLCQRCPYTSRFDAQIPAAATLQ